jgi:hypothetical protein
VQGKGIGNTLKEVMKENVPNLEKEKPIQVQKACRTLNRQDQNTTSPCHITTKTLNVENKERILKAAKEKGQTTHKGEQPTSQQTVKARTSCNDAFQVLRENNCQPRLLYPAKLSFTTEEVKPSMINKN